MTTVYTDNFTGSGTLAAHTSDSGHGYTNWTSGFPAANILLSGGLATAGQGTQGGGKATVVVPAEYTLTTVLSIGSHAPGQVSGLTFYMDGAYYRSLDIGQTGISFALPGGGNGTAQIPFVTGTHTLKLVATLVDEGWYFDDVLIVTGDRIAPAPGWTFGFSLWIPTGAFLSLDSFALANTSTPLPTELLDNFNGTSGVKMYTHVPDTGSGWSSVSNTVESGGADAELRLTGTGSAQVYAGSSGTAAWMISFLRKINPIAVDLVLRGTAGGVLQGAANGGDVFMLELDMGNARAAIYLGIDSQTAYIYSSESGWSDDAPVGPLGASGVPVKFTMLWGNDLCQILINDVLVLAFPGADAPEGTGSLYFELAVGNTLDSIHAYMPAPKLGVWLRDDFTGSGQVAGRTPDGVNSGPWENEGYWSSGDPAEGAVSDGNMVSVRGWDFGVHAPLAGNPLDAYLETRVISTDIFGWLVLTLRHINDMSGPLAGDGVSLLVWRNSDGSATADFSVHATPAHTPNNSVDFTPDDVGDFILRMEVEGLALRVFIDGTQIMDKALNVAMVDGGGVCVEFDEDFLMLGYIEAGEIGDTPVDPPAAPFWTSFTASHEVP